MWFLWFTQHAIVYEPSNEFVSCLLLFFVVHINPATRWLLISAFLQSVTIFFTYGQVGLPSVLWCCWLGGRKGIRPVKKLEWWGTGMVICLERDADLHMAQLMPLPITVSCFSKIQIGFTFLVPAHPGSPGKRAVKRVCVCVYGQVGLREICINK